MNATIKLLSIKVVQLKIQTNKCELSCIMLSC